MHSKAFRLYIAARITLATFLPIYRGISVSEKQIWMLHPTMPLDFSGQNLRGRSFKGQNLEGANFSGADIRSADFTGANLRRANFSHATAGLQRRWTNILLLVSLLLAVLSGLISTLCGVVAPDTLIYLFNIFSIISFVVLAVGLLFTIQLGYPTGLMAITLATALVVVMALILALFGAVNIAVAMVISAAVGILINLVVNTAVTMAMVVAGISAGFVIGVVAIAATATGAATTARDPLAALSVTTIVTLASITGVIVGTRRANLILAGEYEYPSLRSLFIAFASVSGTSFKSCDLTDANFSRAILKSTDFRKANITRTCFWKAQKLELAYIWTMYLDKPQVCQLVMAGEGQNKNYDGFNLRGVNLSGANLADASFIGADLSEANLQDADLSRAKLVQTQLDGTDLTGATLTGVYIQDWGITTDTKFDGVRCEYVYMRLPTKENPDPLRKPDNHKEVFADGEFGDFLKPIVDTLDLYHNQGVDPRAIAISFKQLAENHPEADLRIVGIEVRGEDKFLLRAKTAATADKSQLSAEYFTTYNETKALPEREVKLLLAEKDDRIRSLENFVIQALQRPNYYSNTQIQEVGTMNPNQGGINQSANNSQFSQGQQAAIGSENQMSMNNNENYKTKYDFSNADVGNVVDTAQSGSQQIGKQYNYAPEQKQNLVEAALEIQQLLEQLSQYYPTNTITGKMALATEATQRIENNPTLMQKTISALRAGGTAALEQALSHPAASFVIAALDDWNKNNQ